MLTEANDRQVSRISCLKYVEEWASGLDATASTRKRRRRWRRSRGSSQWKSGRNCPL